MRTLSSTLLAAQQSTSTDALVKVVLTHGATLYTYDRSRILNIVHREEPFRHSAKVMLDNSDGALTALDLKGFQTIISYGARTSAGEEYSACAPLWVIAQRLKSSQGKLACELELAGIPDMLAEDKANASYIPTDSDTKTVKTLLTEIITAALACYSHCHAYSVVFDSEDSLIDVYMPKDGFRIYVNGSRLAAIRRLLDYTKCVMRAEDDGAIHILEPTISTDTAWAALTAYSLRAPVILTTPNDYQYICTTAGTSAASEPTWPTGIGDTVNDGTVVWTVAYDYKYSLESGHTFFSKAYRKTLVIPNYVVVQSQPDDSPSYSGYASDSESIAAFREVREYHSMRLQSNAQAASIAEAILSKYQLNAELGDADVPMNCGAELFDFIKVADERESDYRVGNTGSLTRKYSPGKNPPHSGSLLNFSFGGWLTVRGLLSDLETYSDIGLNFYRLTVKTLYAERLKLDDIIDGTYGKVLSTSISAGKIELDEVVEGTYGKVLSTQLSSGYLKLTSQTVKSGEWYNQSGVEIDAAHGINIYGVDSALTTRATKTGTIQCKVDAAGAITAGAGTVILDADGVTIKGQKLKLQTAAAGSSSYVYVSAGGDLVLLSASGKWTYVYQEGLYSNSLRLPAGGWFGVYGAIPQGIYFNTATTWKGTTGCDHLFLPSKAAVAGVGWGYIGNATNFWYKMYSQYYYYKTAPASFQEHDDIAMLKGMKPKKQITKEGREVSLIDMATIPAEVKVREKRDDTPPGQPDEYEEFIDGSALTGLVIGTLKKLIDKVEALERR